MKELGQILDRWRERPEGILATVVQVKGSSYRRPGARMLILPDGGRIGSVSGGCLEGDLSRKAWWLTEDGRPAVRTYDTTSDDDAVWEFGLGCNGVIDVLLERLDTPEAAEAMQFLAQVHDRRKTATIATVIRGGPAGARLWLQENGQPAGSLRGSSLAFEIEPLLRSVTASRVVSVDGTEIFIELVQPPQTLVIFGAGHDAVPLVNIAKELGWHVTVADGRPAYANAERFPSANCLHLLLPDRALAGIEITRDAAVVLMTHNYPQDRLLLPYLLSRPLFYLGMLGPRVRTARLFEELGAEPPPYVYAPVGLDIGAGSPETIALAIIAEISAALARRSGGLLRDREAPIYDHPATPPLIRPVACETGF